MKSLRRMVIAGVLLLVVAAMVLISVSFGYSLLLHPRPKAGKHNLMVASTITRFPMSRPSATIPATKTSTGTFTTLPPNSVLPSDAECAARVRTISHEVRPDNTKANSTNVYAQGYRLVASDDPAETYATRVTGNFSGTTDEILQWAACKWGIDEHIVKAQAVAESDWHQAALGDCQRPPTQPATHGCQSLGILQVKGADIPPTFPGTWPYAWNSTAFNADFALAVRRACYDGKISWLDHGYKAGDIWGCVGQWFSGSWHDAGANHYSEEVKQDAIQQAWLQPGF